jgi:hypothetical protein
MFSYPEPLIVAVLHESGLSAQLICGVLGSSHAVALPLVTPSDSPLQESGSQLLPT